MIRYSIFGPWCEINTPDEDQLAWLPWWFRWGMEPCQCYNCLHYDTVGGFIWIADSPVVSPARSGLEELAERASRNRNHPLPNPRP